MRRMLTDYDLAVRPMDEPDPPKRRGNAATRLCCGMVFKTDKGWRLHQREAHDIEVGEVPVDER
jgi:hypothetical protein